MTYYLTLTYVIFLTILMMLDFASFFFFSKPLFTQKEKLNLKTYNSTLLDIRQIEIKLINK